PETGWRCPDSHRAVTVISALVRVPVLSVQMTVVDPSVSTAASRLIRAWRAAIRRTAMARDTERVAGIPSGTSATMTPRANTKLSISPAEVVAARRPKMRKGNATATHHHSRHLLGHPVDVPLQRAGDLGDLGGHLVDLTELRIGSGGERDRRGGSL